MIDPTVFFPMIYKGIQSEE